MKRQNIILIVLLLAVVSASIGYLIYNKTKQASVSDSEETENTDDSPFNG